MIRKAIIVVLTLATVLVVVAWIAHDVFGFARHYGRYAIGYSRIIVVGDGMTYRQNWHTSRSYDFNWQDLVPIWSHVDEGPYLGLPFWIPFLLSATYPTIALIRGPLRRRRRRKSGLCLQCGYSVEGNVSGTCPECGTPMQP